MGDDPEKRRRSPCEKQGGGQRPSEEPVRPSRRDGTANPEPASKRKQVAAKLPTEPVPEKPGMPLSGACGGAAWGTPASALREDSCPAPDLDASRKDLGGETSSPACPGQRAGREING